jgi:hypothetical protein
MLDSKLDNALKLLDKAYAKVQTKVQMKAKATNTIQARVRPQKVQKIPPTLHKS